MCCNVPIQINTSLSLAGYLLGCDGLLHLDRLLGDVGERHLHGELDAVEQLHHQT